LISYEFLGMLSNEQFTAVQGEPTMTLDEYRREFGWSISELARQAGIDPTTANKALNGERVTGRVAVALAKAISNGLGQKVRYQEIDGLNVKL